MEFSTELTDAVVQMFQQQIVQYVADHPEAKLSELEAGLRQAVQKMGAQALQAGLSGLEASYPEAHIPCRCGQAAEYQFRRAAKTLTVFGWVEYRRAYYVCPACHNGQCPLDKRFGLEPGKVSASLSTLLAIAGVETSFEKACQLVERFLLLEVSDNTLRKETQTFGRLQEQIEADWQAQSQDPQALQTRLRTSVERPGRLYGSLDGVQTPLEGEWRELKVGSWYEVEKVRNAPGSQVGDLDELRAKNITYYCDITEAQAFGTLLWASAVQRSADLANEIIFVADGAAWIWNLVERNFPHAVQIVDWYHAVEYLPPIAEAAFGAGSQPAKAWLDQVCMALWDGQVQDVIAACKAFQSHPHAGEVARKAVTYYTNNAKRMDYARFRAAGYQIGSGTVESGCKQIATQRLKRAGARWTLEGARLTAKARAAWLSGAWNQLSASRAALPLAT